MHCETTVHSESRRALIKAQVHSNFPNAPYLLVRAYWLFVIGNHSASFTQLKQLLETVLFRVCTTFRYI